MAWNEAEHPRHPEGSTKGGQFAPKDGAGEAARSAAGVKTHEKARQETFQEFHQWTLDMAEEEGDHPSGLTHEEAWMLSPEGEKLGNPGESHPNGFKVGFTQREISQMKGQWMIHNHPLPSTFSGADLEFGLKHGLEGMAVSNSIGLSTVTFHGRDVMREAASSMIDDLWDRTANGLLWEAEKKLEAGEITMLEIEQNFIDSTYDILETIDRDETYGRFIDYNFTPWEDLE